MDSLLIATNNFWLGGRETYLATWLEHLGMRAALIASSIDRDVPGLELYEATEECGTEEYAKRWASWLERGAKVVGSMRPSVIWAHHFELLPAWLLSRIHRVPLLTTFHGPLIGAGRPNDLMQALGITLAIHRGEAVSGVSEEVLEGIRSLHGGSTPRLLPNTVTIPPTTLPAAAPPRKFVLLTRRDKLEHIRQSALLFARYARRVPGCRLVVADGEMKFRANEARSLRAALRQLGGRWAASQGFGFLRALPRVHFIGWTAEARRHIREADVVLGMGRVVLEGLAEERTAVLVGYRAVHGVVTPGNFDTFRRTNFSGRGLPDKTHDVVVEELLRGRPDLSSRRDAISAQAWTPALRSCLEETSRAAAGDTALADSMAAALRGGASAAEVFQLAVRSLRDEELRTLYRVSEG